MRVSLHTALLLLATTTTVAVGACGGNVVVDNSVATGGATTTTSVNTTTGFGASQTTTTTGFGGSNATVGTGFGGSQTTVGTGFGGSNTTTGFGTTTTSTVSVSSSTGTGAGGSGACTDGLDQKILDNELLYPVIVMCAEQNLGNPSANAMCIETQTGLTPACTSCVVNDLECSLAHCQNPCVGGPFGAACQTCRNDQCGAQFSACSGFSEAPGSTTCASTLLDGTKGMGWQRGLPAEAFVSASGYQSYQLIDQCACGQSTVCAVLCDDLFTSGPANFCNGAVSSGACLMCLESSCGSAMMKCDQN